MNRNFLIFSLTVLLVFGANAVWAADNILPHPDFTPMTPARADSVDANFSALESAIPVMWANIDQEPLGFTLAGVSSPAVVNSVNIRVPAPGGFLLIMGSAFVFNLTNSAVEYILNPLVDGVPLNVHTFLADFRSSTSLTSADFKYTLSYTYTVDITAGDHLISQELGPFPGGVPINFMYNKNNLNVLFFPLLPGGAAISTPGQPAGADTTTGENRP